jgi:hypothetical protein
MRLRVVVVEAEGWTDDLEGVNGRIIYWEVSKTCVTAWHSDKVTLGTSELHELSLSPLLSL